MGDQRFVSPNEMMDAAKSMMLDGREPETTEDWYRVVNFVAANVDPRVASVVTSFVVKVLFSCPLSDTEVEQVVQFQLSRVPQS